MRGLLLEHLVFSWRLFAVSISRGQSVGKMVRLGHSNNDHVIRLGQPLSIYDVANPAYRHGMEILRAEELFLDWLNIERGGINVAGVRHTVELTVIDDELDTHKAVAASRYLVERLGISIILGPLSSSLSGPVAHYTNGSGSLFMAPNAAAPPVFANKPLAFGLLTPAGYLWLQPAIEEGIAKGARTIGVLYEQSAFNLALCSSATNAAATVISSFPGPDPWNTNFSLAVAELKRADPDIVIGCVYDTGVIELVTEMYYQDYLPRMLIVPITLQDEFWQRLEENGLPADAGRFLVGVDLWDKLAPLSSEWADGLTASAFANKYREFHQSGPSFVGAYAWAALETLMQAIERANSLDPTLLGEHLKKTDIITLAGHVRFDMNNQNINPCNARQFSASSSTAVFVAPESAKSGELIYPMPPWNERNCTAVTPEHSVYGYGPDGSCGICPEVAVFNWSMQQRRCQACPVGEYSAERIATTHIDIAQRECRLRCPDGSVEIHGRCEQCRKGSRQFGTICIPCPVGEFVATSGRTKCDRCAAGKSTSQDGMSECSNCSPGQAGLGCVPCPLGEFAATSGQKRCLKCIAGTIAESTGMTTCANCSAGYFQRANGKATCDSCDVGTYSGLGATSCKFCPLGRYQMTHGSSDCVNCRADLSTPYPGAQSFKLCGCPTGRFLPMSDGMHAAMTHEATTINGTGCHVCPWGMNCPGFFPGVDDEQATQVLAGHHRQPLTKKRFYAEAEAPYVAYMCKRAEWCPGNRLPGPETCAENRHYFGCGGCKKTYTEAKSGDCRKCSPSDPVLFQCCALTIFFVLPLAIYASYDVNLTHARQTAKHVALSSGHILVYFLEACAIMGDMNIKWPFPVNEMLQSTSLFSFDLDQLRPACALGGSYKFETKYLLGVSIPLLIGVYFVALLSVSKVLVFLLRLPCRGLRFERTVCSFGIIYVGLYVAVCRSSLRMFECFRVNPAGRAQLSAYPYVECLSDRWWSMLPLAVMVCLIYGVATFAFTTWICTVAVSRFIKNDAAFCKCFGFIFHEFRRDRWWWLPFVLARNLSLPMALVISPGDGQAQSAIMFSFNLLYLIGVVTFWPWLTYAVNVLDTLTMGVGLLMIGSLTSSFVDETVDEPNKAVYAALLCGSLVGSFAALIALWVGHLAQHLLSKISGESLSLRRHSSNTSDDNLSALLIQVSQTFVDRGEEDAKHTISHLSDADRKAVKNYLAIAVAEFLQAKDMAAGLPKRLIMGHTLMFAVDSLKDSTESMEVHAGVSAGGEVDMSSTGMCMESELSIAVAEVEPASTPHVPPMSTTWKSASQTEDDEGIPAFDFPVIHDEDELPCQLVRATLPVGLQ